MISREENTLADKLSYRIDYDGWYITPEVFKKRASIDKLVSEKNQKTISSSVQI